MSNKAGKEAGDDGAAVGAASTALPYVGLGVNLLQTGMGLVQASEQAANEREAQRVAEIATKMRVQQQEQEFFKKAQIPMEAYNRGLREGTAQQAQAIGALQEGDNRQLLGAIGKVNAVGVDQIAGLTDEMAQKKFDLSKLQAQEGMLGADDLAKIYEDRAIGAQKAAQAANLAEVGALNSALTGITDFATRVDAARNEYKKAKKTDSNTQKYDPNLAFKTNMNGLGSIAPAVSTPDSYKNEINIIPEWQRPTGGGKPYSLNSWANPNYLFELDMYGNPIKR